MFRVEAWSAQAALEGVMASSGLEAPQEPDDELALLRAAQEHYDPVLRDFNAALQAASQMEAPSLLPLAIATDMDLQRALLVAEYLCIPSADMADAASPQSTRANRCRFDYNHALKA